MYAVANDMCFCFCLGDRLILSVSVSLRQDTTDPTILVHFLFICMFSIGMIKTIVKSNNPSKREDRKGTEGRNLELETETATMEEHYLLVGLCDWLNLLLHTAQYH